MEFGVLWRCGTVITPGLRVCRRFRLHLCFTPIGKGGPSLYFHFFSKHFHVGVALKIGGFVLVGVGTLAVMRLAVIGPELLLRYTFRRRVFAFFFSERGNVAINPPAWLSPMMGGGLRSSGRRQSNRAEGAAETVRCVYRIQGGWGGLHAHANVHKAEQLGFLPAFSQGLVSP